MQMIALFFLVTASIGGVAWVFVYPILSGERKAEKRQESVARTGAAVRVIVSLRFSAFRSPDNSG